MAKRKGLFGRIIDALKGKGAGDRTDLQSPASSLSNKTRRKLARTHKAQLKDPSIVPQPVKPGEAVEIGGSGNENRTDFKYWRKWNRRYQRMTVHDDLKYDLERPGGNPNRLDPESDPDNRLQYFFDIWSSKSSQKFTAVSKDGHPYQYGENRWAYYDFKELFEEYGWLFVAPRGSGKQADFDWASFREWY